MQVMKVTFWEHEMRQPGSGSVMRDDTGGWDEETLSREKRAERGAACRWN
jgi:hypothetical protein